MTVPMRRVTGDSATPGLHYSSSLMNCMFTGLISKLFPPDFSQATSWVRELFLKKSSPSLPSYAPARGANVSFLALFTQKIPKS